MCIKFCLNIQFIKINKYLIWAGETLAGVMKANN